MGASDAGKERVRSTTLQPLDRGPCIYNSECCFQGETIIGAGIRLTETVWRRFNATYEGASTGCLCVEKTKGEGQAERGCKNRNHG